MHGSEQVQALGVQRRGVLEVKLGQLDDVHPVGLEGLTKGGDFRLIGTWSVFCFRCSRSKSKVCSIW
jgi:hypothetical protein